MDKKTSLKLLDNEEIIYTTHLPFVDRTSKLIMLGGCITFFSLPWFLLPDIYYYLGVPPEISWLQFLLFIPSILFFLVLVYMSISDLLTGGRNYYITTQRLIIEVVRERAREIWSTKILFLNELDYILFLNPFREIRFFSIKYPINRTFSGNEHLIDLHLIREKFTFYIVASGKYKRKLIELKDNLKIILPSLQKHSSLEGLFFIPR